MTLTESRNTTTNICVIGASGLIGLRHTQHCLEEPSVYLSCIVDPTPAGQALAQKHHLVYFSDVESMIQGDVKVDGAILATPNATHVPLGLMLVKAGIHVLVEKPLSTTIESGRALVSEAEEMGVRILTGHHRRFNPYTVAAKEMIDAGRLGQVLAIQGTWTTLKPLSYFTDAGTWRKDPRSGGPILINLIHELDLLRYFLGDIVHVYCKKALLSTRGFEVEETGAVLLTFASGAVGTFVFSDASASPHSWEGATGENPNIPHTGETAYTFFGTKGTVSIPQLKLFHYENTSSGCWTDPLIADPSPPLDATPPLLLQLRHFAHVCQGLASPNCSGTEGLKSIIVLETIRESMITGQPLDVAQG